jgi:SAM-dependent methyltransferase
MAGSRSRFDPVNEERMGFYRDCILPRAINLVLARPRYEVLRRAVTPGLRGTVLEIGFGSGLNLPHYPPGVDRVIAVDPARLGRKLARGRIRGCHAPVEFRDLDGETYPLASASIDSALSTWTLCTIPGVASALSEIRRVLKPGGRFHFLEHGISPDRGVASWQRRLNPLQILLAGGCRLDRPVDRIIRGSGLEIQTIDTFYKTGPKFISYMYRGTAVNPA